MKTEIKNTGINGHPQRNDFERRSSSIVENDRSPDKTLSEPNNLLLDVEIIETSMDGGFAKTLESTVTEDHTKPAGNSTSKPASAAKDTRLDVLKDSNVEIYAENVRLVMRIEDGLSVSEAIKDIGVKRPRRTVQDLVTRYRKSGNAGLKDGRWNAVKPKRVMTDEVTDITLSWFYERSAAGYRAVAELTAETCRERGLPIPSQSSVKKYLRALPKSVQLARKGNKGLEKWQQQGASVVEQKKTTFSNELWQGDHTPPKIWVRQKIKGSWEPVKVYLSAFVDDYSRAVPGFIVSTKYYDAWTISILSRFSISRKENPGWLVSGLPVQIESDQGADWIGENVQTNWQSLGINAVIDPPRYPNLKGKVERWFRFLDSNCLRKLPGHYDAIGGTEGAAWKHVYELLTLEQLREEITKWIVNVYHRKVHGETGRKPIELWEETVHYRPVENEDDLNILLLKYDKERTVLNCGVRMSLFGERHRYWAPQFDGLWHRKVRVRYNPEDTESVLLYCAATGEFLCEAWDMRAENPKYTYEDVKKARWEEKRYLRGIQIRTKEYFKDVLANDRVVEQQKEWKEAREIAAALPVPETLETEGSEVEDLISLFRQRDRGNQ